VNGVNAITINEGDELLAARLTEVGVMPVQEPYDGQEAVVTGNKWWLLLSEYYNCETKL
jgi:hypothetical protein